MNPITLDLEVKKQFESLYWEQGMTLDNIARQHYASRDFVQRRFRLWGIPTNFTLIRDFKSYLETGDIEYYLRGYMNFWNRYSYDSKDNKVAWRVVCEKKSSLRLLRSYLKEKAYAEGSIIRYRETSNALCFSGLMKCISLSDYFDLDWGDKLREIEKSSPWGAPKIDQGEALNLVLSFTNGEWKPASSIAEIVGYDARYTSKILRRAVEKGYVERRPISGRRFEYRRIKGARI